MERFDNVILKIINFVAIWIIGIFGWNITIFTQTPSPLRGCYGNQVNTM